MKFNLLSPNTPMMWHSSGAFWGSRPKSVPATEYTKDDTGNIYKRDATETHESEWEPVVISTKLVDWN